MEGHEVAVGAEGVVAGADGAFDLEVVRGVGDAAFAAEDFHSIDVEVVASFAEGAVLEECFFEP